jgi:hypothetical protein
LLSDSPVDIPPPSFSALVNNLSFTDLIPAEPLTIHGLLLCDRGGTAEVEELEKWREEKRTGQDRKGKERKGKKTR